ncbi:hypothetical protein AAF712_011200 [Marasmius tenuissimus]|uniref:Uncharacterized protein n=1 Tax=Marasmius tenuissimus TaxID=585030 RepID=A0ABR2ZK28_9AGAR|nr:hypothetical protein PM082_016064 [Marasmius tenuissimus]
MFSKFVVQFVAIAAFALTVAASPVAKPSIAARGFTRWGGFASLDHFDNFYGVNDFTHARFDQVVVEERQLVCRTQAVEVIQQRLVVLQEMAKRIITEQICEVETQTIVFSQFHASLGNFYNDLRRHSSHQVGFDSAVADHFGSIVQSDGSLSTNDLGFTGSDVGKSTVVAQGSNWDDRSSPASVENAYFAAQGARSGF